MFGGLAFLINGNMAVSASGQGGLLLRVDPGSSAELIDEPNVRRFEMRGRQMAGWLRVDPAVLGTEDELARWVDVGVSLRAVTAGRNDRGPAAASMIGMADPDDEKGSSQVPPDKPAPEAGLARGGPGRQAQRRGAAVSRQGASRLVLDRRAEPDRRVRCGRMGRPQRSRFAVDGPRYGGCRATTAAAPKRDPCDQHCQVRLDEPLPWKYAALRSRFPPAPGGNHCPMSPAAFGSSSGADDIAREGIADEDHRAAASATPGIPISANRPGVVALIDSSSSAMVDMQARCSPGSAPRKHCAMRVGHQAGYGAHAGKRGEQPPSRPAAATARSPRPR